MLRYCKTEYNLTDQTSTTLSSGLGNVRVVFAAHANGQPEVMQQTSYYPFGYTLQQNDFSTGITSENKNLYNGKELQNDVLAGSRLDWYDYGARFYDPVVGRWHSVDPLIEMHQDYTAYSYVYNNPIKLLDPNGCDSASDARINEIVKAYISSNPKIHVTINGEVVNEGTSGSYDEAKENNDIDESSLYRTFNAVSDNTSIVGDYIDSFELAALYTGVKLGRSSKKGLAFYGYSFFGNQYTRIIKLKVPIKVGGVLVNAVMVVSDLGAIGTAPNSEAKQNAKDNLYKNLVFIGISAISAEVGVVLSVGDYIMSTPEMQRFKKELQMKREQEQGILHPPSGQLYFNQGRP